MKEIITKEPRKSRLTFVTVGAAVLALAACGEKSSGDDFWQDGSRQTLKSPAGTVYECDLDQKRVVLPGNAVEQDLPSGETLTFLNFGSVMGSSDLIAVISNPDEAMMFTGEAPRIPAGAIGELGDGHAVATRPSVQIPGAIEAVLCTEAASTSNA